MKIVSCDVGTRNCAFAIYENNRLASFGCYDLLSYANNKKQKTDYALLVFNFIKKHPEIFKNMDKLLIEVQIQARMREIATALRCFFFKQAVKISPLAVHNFFSSGNKGIHKKNKKSAEKLVEKFLTGSQLEKLRKHKKRDDISDAVIMIFYYLQKQEK